MTEGEAVAARRRADAKVQALRMQAEGKAGEARAWVEVDDVWRWSCPAVGREAPMGMGGGNGVGMGTGARRSQAVLR